MEPEIIGYFMRPSRKNIRKLFHGAGDHKVNSSGMQHIHEKDHVTSMRKIMSHHGKKPVYCCNPAIVFEKDILDFDRPNLNLGS